jgi:hypothetical protein
MSEIWVFKGRFRSRVKANISLQTLKSGSLIGRRIETNPDEFRLGVKAITKY